MNRQNSALARFLHKPLLEGKVPTPPFIIGIFLTVFLDLIAFGLFIPDLQLRGKELGATPVVLGILLAAFSGAQLVTSPFLGRLSDRYGRRSVLLISTLLSALSYVNYAFAGNVWMLGISRILSGIAAANLGVAFAYVADVTEPKDRAKSLGLLGAAFGLGFTLGPPAGGFLLFANHGSPIVLGLLGASLSFANFLYVLLVLPESKKFEPGVVHTTGQKNIFQLLKVAFGEPRLALVLLIFFAVSLGFTNLEGTYFLLLASPNSVFHLSDNAARIDGAVLLTFVGLVAAVVQGVLIGIVNKRFGEMQVLRVASLALVPALAIIPFMPLWIPAIFSIIYLGTSNGLTGPNINSLVSKLAPAEIRGAIFGVNQSLGSLARMIGPFVSIPLFYRVHIAAPYFLGATVVFVAAALCWTIKTPPAEDRHISEDDDADPQPASELAPEPA